MIVASLTTLSGSVILKKKILETAAGRLLSELLLTIGTENHIVDLEVVWPKAVFMGLAPHRCATGALLFMMPLLIDIEDQLPSTVIPSLRGYGVAELEPFQSQQRGLMRGPHSKYAIAQSN